MEKGKTFADYYYEARAKSHPSVEFITKIAELTHRTPIAVRKWITGENTPDYNCQEIIANFLGVPREQLFPPKDGDCGGGGDDDDDNNENAGVPAPKPNN